MVAGASTAGLLSLTSTAGLLSLICDGGCHACALWGSRAPLSSAVAYWVRVTLLAVAGEGLGHPMIAEMAIT